MSISLTMKDGRVVEVSLEEYSILVNQDYRRLLAALSESPHLSVYAVARKAGMTPSKAWGYVHRLVGRGYVKVSPAARPNGAKRVAFTEKGKTLLDHALTFDEVVKASPSPSSSPSASARPLEEAKKDE